MKHPEQGLSVGGSGIHEGDHNALNPGMRKDEVNANFRGQHDKVIVGGIRRPGDQSRSGGGWLRRQLDGEGRAAAENMGLGRHACAKGR